VEHAVDPVVKSITLRRFRSIPAGFVELDNPTILVGRNGSEKSNFADCFAFISECMSSPLQAVFDRRGGIGAVRNRSSGISHPPNMGLSVSLGSCNGDITRATYAFEVCARPNSGFEVVREQCRVFRGERFDFFDRTKATFDSSVASLKPGIDPTALVLPLVGGDERFAPVSRVFSSMRVYSIQPSELREVQDPDVGTSLHRNGSNAASVLRVIQRQDPGRFERIGEILGAIVPKTLKVATIKHGKKLTLEFLQDIGSDRTLKLEAFNMSDGTLRAVGLLAAVFQVPTPSLIVVEEPEATMHPGALPALLDLLRDASKRMQVVITTHSPELLDAKWITDRHLRVAHWDAGATRITGLAEVPRNALRQHLKSAGELLRSNVLDEPLEADLFCHERQLELFEPES